MRKQDLFKGRLYGFRPKGTGVGDPLGKIRVIGPARGRQCRIRYEDGELEGFDEWVSTFRIVCPWGQRKAFLRDEERRVKLHAADDEIWDSVVEDAICHVTTASGEYGGFAKGWTTDPASAQRFWDRARLKGTPLEYDPLNFANRDGEWHLSFKTALHASRSFAAAEPEIVDLYLRNLENQLKAKGFEPGSSFEHELLRQWSPGIALARSWTQRSRGYAAEKEIERLRELVHTAARYLRNAGEYEDARRIELALEGQ